MKHKPDFIQNAFYMSSVGNHIVACYGGAFTSHLIHMFNNYLLFLKWNVDTQNLKNKTNIQVNFLIALFWEKINFTLHSLGFQTIFICFGM